MRRAFKREGSVLERSRMTHRFWYLTRAALGIFALALAGCGGGGSSSQPLPPVYGWTWFYSPGMFGSCADFDFPYQDGAHYCVGPLSAQPGQRLRMTFTI